MKIYCAHSHRHRLDAGWLEHQLRDWGHTVYNPFTGDSYARTLTHIWAKAEETGDQPQLRSLCEPIYHKDLSHIADSDAVVVYYPDESTGTAMEIAIAHHHRKLVIVLTDMIHPFIQCNADHVLPCNPVGIEQIRKLLEEAENG